MKTLFLFILIALLALSAEAATNYIRRAASGSATGADWSNAYTNLPATLTRGDVYLIADGDDYGSYNFNDAVSGSEYIRLQKATASAHGTDTGWVNSYGDGQAKFRQIQIDQAYFILDGASGTSNQARGILIEHDSTVSGLGGIYTTLTFTDAGLKHHLHLLSLELTQPAGDKHGDSSFQLYSSDTNGSWADPLIVVSNCYSHDVGGLNFKHVSGGWAVLANNYFETCCGLDTASHKELAKWDSTNCNYRVYGNVFKDWQGYSVTGGLVIGGEGVDGFMRDWQIYNNLFVWTDRTSPGGTNTWSGGSRAIGGLDSSDTDHDEIHVWNNTFVNITDSTAANIFQNGIWTGNNTASNNLFVACPGLNAIYELKGSNAFYQCTSYTPGTHEFILSSDPLIDSGNGSAHLASDPGVGMDLSTFFAGDFLGAERPPWTLGALAFGGGGSPSIVTNNASGARVMGFRGLRMSVLPLIQHNHPASPLLFENFEGTGYSTAGWAEHLTGTGNSINEDNTTNVLSGSQSYALVGIGDDPSFSTNSFAASSSVYGYFQFKCLKYPNEVEDTYRQILALQTSAGTTVFRIKQASAGGVYIDTGGTSDVLTFGALSLHQTYHIWFHWNKDNGANSAATVAISIDQNKPTSGDGFLSILGAQIASDASVIMLGYPNNSEEGSAFNGAPSWVYDYVLLDDAEIQSYP